VLFGPKSLSEYVAKKVGVPQPNPNTALEPLVPAQTPRLAFEPRSARNSTAATVLLVPSVTCFMEQAAFGSTAIASKSSAVFRVT
jgi:hypothetical protein